MHESIEEFTITCPYCWEQYSLHLEVLDKDVDIIEDCQICCHPIQLYLSVDSRGQSQLQLDRAM